MPIDTGPFSRGLSAHLEQAKRAAVRAVDKFGEHVLGDAAELAPVDTGALKASATSEPATLDGNLVTKVLGFSVDYAAAVHERLDLHHDQGEAKFLEKAMEKNAPKMADFIRGEVAGN